MAAAGVETVCWLTPDIGAALNYLKNTGKVERIGQGQWVAVNPEPRPDEFETLPEDDEEPDEEEWQSIRDRVADAIGDVDPDDIPF